MDLSNKHILVTGANGYIGRNLLYFLNGINLRVTAVSRKFNEFLPNIRYFEKDIFDIENPYEYFGKPNIVLHLAWQDGFIHNSHKHVEQISKHFKFLNDLINSGIDNVNVIGTMHEVGFHQGMVTNDIITNPTNLYGISKDALRKSLFSIGNKKIKWLRLFYIYGNDSSNLSVFGKLFQAASRGDLFFPINSGKNQYDFLNINALVKQLFAASIQENIFGIINCCSGLPVYLDEMLKKYIIINNLNIKLDYNKFPDRIGDSKIIYGDNTLINIIMNDFNSQFLF